MKKDSLNGCRGIVTKVLPEYDKYNVRVRCAGSKKAKRIKVLRREVHLHTMAGDLGEVHFVRPEGDLVVKSLNWCRSNGYEEVAPKLWAGGWWDTLTGAQHRKAMSTSARSLKSHEDVTGHDLLAAAIKHMDETDGSTEEETELKTDL